MLKIMHRNSLQVIPQEVDSLGKMDNVIYLLL